MLVMAYPVKAMTNPDFYIKLTLIGLAVLVLYRIKTRVFDDADLPEAERIGKGRMLAISSLLLWAGVIAAGRLLAYTSNYLMFGVTC